MTEREGEELMGRLAALGLLFKPATSEDSVFWLDEWTRVLSAEGVSLAEAVSASRAVAAETKGKRQFGLQPRDILAVVFEQRKRRPNAGLLPAPVCETCGGSGWTYSRDGAYEYARPCECRRPSFTGAA